MKKRKKELNSYKNFPTIGESNRWYDYLFNSINWLSSGKKRKFIPRKIQKFLNTQLNNLFQINEHERNKLFKLDDENSDKQILDITNKTNLLFSGFWAVEFFTPSKIKNLNNFFDNPKMQNPRKEFRLGDSKEELLERFRNQSVTGSFRIGTYLRENSNFFAGSSTIVNLPVGIEVVEITAIQINNSITAIVAQFELTNEIQDRLNEILHENTDPKLEMNKKLFKIYTQKEHKIKKINNFISEIHFSARKWFSGYFHGEFASSQNKQPIFDFFLSHGQDNYSKQKNLIYKALDINSFDDNQNEEYLNQYFNTSDRNKDKKIFYSNLDLLFEEVSNEFSIDFLNGFGDKHSALFRFFGREILIYLSYLSITNLLEMWEYQYSKERDNISDADKNISIKSLKSIRNNLINLSFNISDFGDDWETYINSMNNHNFAEYIKKIEFENESKEFFFNKRIRDYQYYLVKKLQKMDNNYQNTISSIATLGETIDSYKTTRIALYVSFISLLFSIIVNFFSVVI